MGDDSSDVYMPLFVREFLFSTTGWTAEQRGHYLVLLMLQWGGGGDGLPVGIDDLDRLSPGVGGVWPLLEGKFPVCQDGRRRNARLEKHRAVVDGLRKKRGEAGKKGNAARWGDRKRIANGSQSDRKAIANGSQSDRKAIANGSHSVAIAIGSHPNPNPNPKEEQQQQPHARACEDEPAARASASALPQPEDGWTGDIPTLWEQLRERWNASPWVETWVGLVFPRGDLLTARLADPEWVRQWPAALERLQRCRWFEKPVALRQFLTPTFVGDVLCGTFDGPKPAARKRQERDPNYVPF